MTTIFQNYDKAKTAFLNPKDTTEPIEGFPEVCVTTFSENIIKKFSDMKGVSKIAHLYTANGILPVYQINYKGKNIAFFLSRIGAPACVACLEEIIAMGAKKIVMFGCCGILNDALTKDRIIVPSSAVRDEGSSYHYFPASEEIHAKKSSVGILEKCLDDCGIPYITGKTWTTDAIYRETRMLIEERKNQGCLCVEMECSAALAVTEFRNVPFTMFLYGADSLSSERWEPNSLLEYGIKGAQHYMTLAFECALRLSS